MQLSTVITSLQISKRNSKVDSIHLKLSVEFLKIPRFREILRFKPFPNTSSRNIKPPTKLVSKECHFHALWLEVSCNLCGLDSSILLLLMLFWQGSTPPSYLEITPPTMKVQRWHDQGMTHTLPLPCRRAGKL